MSAATTIPILIDSVAAVRETIQAALSTRTSWWDIVDAAADEDFENRMKGTAMTAADTAIDNAAVWGAAALRQLPQLLNTYLRVEEAMSSPYLASYLATVGWRVPYGYAEAYYEATGGRIAAQYVMPPGFQAVDETTPVGRGLHCFGTWTGTATWADVDGALTNSVGAPGVPISMTASPGGTNPIVTLTRYDLGHGCAHVRRDSVRARLERCQQSLFRTGGGRRWRRGGRPEGRALQDEHRPVRGERMGASHRRGRHRGHPDRQ